MKSSIDFSIEESKSAPRFWALVAALALAACSPDGRYDEAPSVRARYTVIDGIVLWESTGERLVHVKADIEDPKTRELFRAKDGVDVVWVQKGPGGDSAQEVFALTSPEDVRDDSAKTTLHRLPVGTGEGARWELGKVFEEIAFDPTGRYAVLSHGDSPSNRSLTNPGEIAVVDLQNPSAPPALHDLYTGGRTTRRIVFPGPVDIAGKTRQLGIVFAEGAVRLFDIADLDARLPLIPLTTRDDGRSIAPVQAIALGQHGDRDARLFIRAQGTRDIYDVTLAESGNGERELAATLNQHETGNAALDMAVAEDGGRTMILTIVKGRGLRVVDVDTGSGFDVPLADSPSQMMLRGDSALAFGASRAVHFIELEGLWAERGSNIETVYLPVGVEKRIASSEDRIIFGGKDASLVLLDLKERRAQRLAGASREVDGHDLWEGRLYFAQDELIDIVELETGAVDQLFLDDRVEGLCLVPSTKTGIVWHGTWTGRATLFLLEDPRRSKAVVLDGIWLDGFLDEEEGR